MRAATSGGKPVGQAVGRAPTARQAADKQSITAPRTPQPKAEQPEAGLPSHQRKPAGTELACSPGPTKELTEIARILPHTSRARAKRCRTKVRRTLQNACLCHFSPHAGASLQGISTWVKCHSSPLLQSFRSVCQHTSIVSLTAQLAPLQSQSNCTQ